MMLPGASASSGTFGSSGVGVFGQVLPEIPPQVPPPTTPPAALPPLAIAIGAPPKQPLSLSGSPSGGHPAPITPPEALAAARARLGRGRSPEAETPPDSTSRYHHWCEDRESGDTIPPGPKPSATPEPPACPPPTYLSSLVWSGAGSSTDSAMSTASPARKAKTSATPAPPTTSATSETSPTVPEETPETPVSASPWAGRTPGLSQRDKERLVALRLLRMLQDLGQLDEDMNLVANPPAIPPVRPVVAKAACKPPAAPRGEPEPEPRGPVVTVDSSSGDSDASDGVGCLWTPDEDSQEIDATGGDF